MADDAKSRLAKLLEGKTTGQLPGKVPGQLTGSFQYQPSVEQQGNLRIVYITDGTVSMSPYINAVQGVIREVGAHVLSSDLKIEAAAMLFDEHAGNGFTPALLRNAQYSRAIQTHLDFLQTNDFTSNPQTLEQQVAELQRASAGNGTSDEPYECAAKYLVDLITEDRKTNPQRKYGVVLFGDDQPHGLPGTQSCPHGVKPAELRVLATLANRTFWVDCDPHQGDGPFRLGTYAPVQGIDTAVYLKFRDAESVLKEALIGMVEQTKGPAAYQNFLDQLSAPAASSIRGLLGGGKK